MEELTNAIMNVTDFAVCYGLHKCIRTMVSGVLFLMPIFFLRRINRKKNVYWNIGLMLLLLPACLMGQSKLFFCGRSGLLFSNWLNGAVTPFWGRVYFGIMALLLLRYVIKYAGLRRHLKKLPFLEQEELKQQIIKKITEKDRTRIFHWYLSRVRIYSVEQEGSPFSGGLIRPYVVIPAKLQEEWRQDEQEVILSHELLHIKSGHIWILTAFSLLRIYWWLNPLIYICEKVLRQDLEIACDESCIYHTGIMEGTYGAIILHMLHRFQEKGTEGTLAFYRRMNFCHLKRRISCLYMINREGYRRKLISCMAVFGIVMMVLLVEIKVFSYPRYTRMEELSLYDDKLQLVSYDLPELHQAVTVVDGRIQIQAEELRQILQEQSIEGEYIYIGYDTIMKVPGVGGGGNTAMISTRDVTDITYLAADGIITQMEEFFLKYLI